jgi:aldehyde dehydrogenase (NAD+)
VYDEVRERLIEGTRNCPTGDPMDPTTVCGPMINSAAADRVVNWVEEAVSLGAVLLAGGSRRDNVVEPTLLEGVPESAKIDHEEVFGPVLTLRSFSTLEEAIARVNSSRFGIQCGVFTSDEAAAQEFYHGLDVGGVVIGDFPTLRFDNMPYGGNKRSGFGREGVSSACEEMSQTKTLLARIV